MFLMVMTIRRSLPVLFSTSLSPSSHPGFNQWLVSPGSGFWGRGRSGQCRIYIKYFVAFVTFVRVFESTGPLVLLAKLRSIA